MSSLRLFIDTGPLAALYNKRDQRHLFASELFQTIAREETPYRRLYTSDYVLDEAVTLVRARTRNHKLSVELGTDIMESKTIVLLNVDQNTLKESWKFYKERPDIALSFTDTISAYLAKQHFITDILSYDEHFESLGFHVIQSKV